MSIFSSLFSSSGSFSLAAATDWHSHILPCVDDGVQEIEDSLAILAEYERMGIQTVWLTPHIMEDMPNSVVSLKENFEKLKRQYVGQVRIHLAAENMIDNLFIERLEMDQLLPIGDKQDMLLVETSYYNPPINLNNTFERIKYKGYYPLLAHPERYNFIESMAEYKQLKSKGMFFQLNLLSLTGYYGKNVMEKSHKLLKKGFYDFFGTDIHRLNQLNHLNQLTLPKDLLRSLELISNAHC